MKKFFQDESALSFAGAIYSLLDSPRSIYSHPIYAKIGKEYNSVPTGTIVEGRLWLRQHGESGETSVGVRLTTSKFWLDGFPLSETDAPFLRREPDWHVPGGKLLCIGLNQEWACRLQELWDKGIEWHAIISFASSWCIQNLDSLITRHLHANRFGITTWPKEWDQWSHGKAGIREFEKLHRRRIESA